MPSNEALRRYFVLYAPSSLIPVINQDSYLVHDQASPHPSADPLNVSQHIAPSLQSPWQTRHHQIFPFSAVKLTALRGTAVTHYAQCCLNGLRWASKQRKKTRREASEGKRTAARSGAFLAPRLWGCCAFGTVCDLQPPSDCCDFVQTRPPFIDSDSSVTRHRDHHQG